MLRYKLIMVFFLLAIACRVFTQNFIGLHKNDIEEVMKKQYSTFKLNTSLINKDYKYLKYEDKINEITLLFFLSEDDNCSMIRKMCDYSNINDELHILNSKYKKAGKNTWSYMETGKTYQVALEEGEFFFTITTKQKK